MPDLIYNVKFNIDDNLQEGVAGAERYEQQVEELEIQVAELTAQLKNATNQQKEFNQGSKTTGATVGKTNKQLAIGNQLFFSLSDGIQDSAQFSQGFSTGMRAVGNNIGFTAELMGVFVAQTAAMNNGVVKLSAVLKGLRGALLGVGGVIFLINTAVTALTFFTQKSDAAKREAKSLADELKSSLSPAAQVLGVSVQEMAVSIGNSIEATVIDLERFNELSSGVFGRGGRVFTIAGVFSDYNEQGVRLEATSKSLIRNAEVVAALSAITDEQRDSIIESMRAEEENVKVKNALDEVLRALFPEYEQYLETVERSSQINEDYNSIILEQQTGLELTSATLKQLEQDIRSEMIAIASSNIAQAEKNRLLKEYQAILNELVDEETSPVEAMSNRINVALAMFNLGLDENKNGLMAVQSEATGFLLEMTSNIENLTDAEILELSKLADEIRKLGVELEITGSKAEDTENSLSGFAKGFSAYTQETQRLVSSLSSLVAASEAETEAQARKQFETQKKLSYASAVVTGAEAVVKALATAPAPNIPLAAIAAAATGIQIAAIAKQKFSYGGGASEFSGGATSALSTYGSGQRLPESRSLLGGSQMDTGRTPAFDGRGEGMAKQPIIINNYANVDSEGLYLTTEYGRKSYQQSAL